MPRGTSLGLVRSMVKAETGKNLSSASTAQDAEINQIISDVQYQLSASHEWPFLKDEWNSSLTPAERYQTFPTVDVAGTTVSPSFERPIKLWIKWNNIWQEVVYGIDEYPEFNYIDSDRGQVLDPIQRWQFYYQTQFQVWPMPASASLLRFVGQRQLATLQTGSTTPPTWNDSATLDLDDQLVCYFAATEYLLREENPKAQMEATKAQSRLNALLGSYPTRTETYCIGIGQPLGRKAIRNVPLVLVAGK